MPTTDSGVTDAGHRVVLAAQGAAAQRRSGDGLGAGDGEPGRHARPRVDGGRLADRAGEARHHLEDVLGDLGDQVGLLA